MALQLLIRGDQVPVFATPDAVKGWAVFALSRAMRERGWQVPAYSFPADRQDLSVLRIVCRNGFGTDLAELVLHDLDAAGVDPRGCHVDDPDWPIRLPPLITTSTDLIATQAGPVIATTVGPVTAIDLGTAF